VRYVDLNGDGKIDENDRTYLGYAFPRYTYGFTYNVKWKGIDFSIMLQGVLKRENPVRGELVQPFHGDYSMTCSTTSSTTGRRRTATHAGRAWQYRAR
jgi:hypothetical protein